MSVRVSTPWVTIATENSDHWQTQSMTVRYDLIASVRLVKCIGRAGIDGADNGIEIILRESAWYSREWMRYKSFDAAAKDHEDLLLCLEAMG